MSEICGTDAKAETKSKVNGGESRTPTSAVKKRTKPRAVKKEPIVEDEVSEEFVSDDEEIQRSVSSGAASASADAFVRAAKIPLSGESQKYGILDFKVVLARILSLSWILYNLSTMFWA